ncbi:hypothetical protein Q7C36_008115 [Tachysurus vachellii]|uniref:Uncharacterized protein n=1 Tax=Tachysurus vachellii TaxID=175792 RepID=A0AA88SWC9_TACVA|nr:hypothetical protein Q7C36_008115 [Tachysurus vachellii]
MQTFRKLKAAVDRLNNADPNPDLASHHGAGAPVAPAVNPSLPFRAQGRVNQIRRLEVNYQSKQPCRFNSCSTTSPKQAGGSLTPGGFKPLR